MHIVFVAYASSIKDYEADIAMRAIFAQSFRLQERMWVVASQNTATDIARWLGSVLLPRTDFLALTLTHGFEGWSNPRFWEFLKSVGLAESHDGVGARVLDSRDYDTGFNAGKKSGIEEGMRRAEAMAHKAASDAESREKISWRMKLLHAQRKLADIQEQLDASRAELDRRTSERALSSPPRQFGSYRRIDGPRFPIDHPLTIEEILKTGYAETAQLLMSTQEDREQIEAIFGDLPIFEEVPKRPYRRKIEK